ncbi:MAG: hypothetical protein ABR518_08250 [Actinomycetota bacterium]
MAGRTLRAARFGLVLGVVTLSSLTVPAAPAAAKGGCAEVGHRLRHSGADAWFTGSKKGAVDTLQVVNPKTGDVRTIKTKATVRPGMLIRGWLHVCRAGENGSWADYSGFVDFFDRTPGGNPFWNQHAGHEVKANRDQLIGRFFQIVPDNPPGSKNFLVLVPSLHYRNSRTPGRGACAPQPRNQCYRGPNFVIKFGDSAIARPAHRDGPPNAKCSAKSRSGYAAMIEGVYDNSRGDVRIPNGGAVAAGHYLHVRLLFCANTTAIRLPTIALKFVTRPNDETAPWQSAPTVPKPVTGDRLHKWLGGGSIYQEVPREAGNAVYGFIPRILSKAGALPDNNILAQGGVFRFTVCERFNGVTCL